MMTLPRLLDDVLRSHKRGICVSPAAFSMTERFKIIAGVAFWIAAVLTIFQPFGLFSFSIRIRFLFILGFIAVNVAALTVNLILIAELPWFVPHRWTLWKCLTWVLFLNSSTALANLLFVAQLSSSIAVNLHFALRAELIAAVLVLVPVEITGVLFRKRSRSGRTDAIEDDGPDRLIVIKDEKGRPCFKVRPQELFAIAAAQNYVEVIWEKQGRLEKTLVRNSLKKIERTILNDPLLVRCHRAYLVNLHKVESIKRDGYSHYLVIRDEDIRIPVSRRYVNGVREQLYRQ